MPDEVKVIKDCYFCANAPRIDMGKPYCVRWHENIEPMWTGKEGTYGGWTCEDVAKECPWFKPREKVKQ